LNFVSQKRIHHFSFQGCDEIDDDVKEPPLRPNKADIVPLSWLKPVDVGCRSWEPTEVDPTAEVGEPDVFASTAAATIVMKEYVVRKIHMKSCTNLEHFEENQKLALLRGYRGFEAFGTKCRVTAWGQRNNIQELLNNEKAAYIHQVGL